MTTEYNTCYYCGCRLHKINRTVDHFVPKSYGGTSFVNACKDCNSNKGDLTAKMFKEILGIDKFYGEIRVWVPW